MTLGSVNDHSECFEGQSIKIIENIIKQYRIVFRPH